MLVDNDSFLRQLTALFESSKGKSSIWLTHKRLTYDGEDTTKQSTEDGTDTKEYPCIVRATNGKEVKLSTRIEAGQLERFHVAYGTLLKSSMSSLRKRDKKREKQRAEEIARRKKRLSEQIAIQGPKRGAGRKKHQRLVKAVLKLDDAKKRAAEKEETKSRAKAI